MGHIGNGAYGQWGQCEMGYRGIGYIGNETHRGKVVQWVWGIGPIRPTGGMEYRGYGHMGNRDTGAYCQYLLDLDGGQG